MIKITFTNLNNDVLLTKVISSIISRNCWLNWISLLCRRTEPK